MNCTAAIMAAGCGRRKFAFLLDVFPKSPPTIYDWFDTTSSIIIPHLQAPVSGMEYSLLHFAHDHLLGGGNVAF
jgi:hypothetical protein